MKKILSVLLSAVMLFCTLGVMPFSASAEAGRRSGVCGDRRLPGIGHGANRALVCRIPRSGDAAFESHLPYRPILVFAASVMPPAASAPLCDTAFSCGTCVGPIQPAFTPT